MIACEFLDNWTVKDALIFFSGLLTPLLAIIASYIACQQWRTNRLKVQHDLYERRFAIYTALIGFLREGKEDKVATFTFLQKIIGESHFLFGKEISNYLDTVYKKAVAFQYQNSELNSSDLPAGERRSNLANEYGESLKWFGDQFEVAREKFAKYLKLY
jgi:hypothetical protein